MMFRPFAVLPGPALLLLAGALVLGCTDVSAQDLDFVDSGQLLGNDYGNDVALGDLDGDGDLDAFVVNGFISLGPNQVYINQGGGQGGMAGQLLDSGQALGSGYSQAVALADLDGDGDLDAFVANVSNGTDAADRIWWNDGSGTFQSGTQLLGNANSNDVALADVDGDGDIDAVVAAGAFGVANTLWMNQGGAQGGVEGVFVAVGTLGTASARAVGLGDLDRDGDVDALLGVAQAGNEIWINQGGAQLGTPGMFVDSGQRLVQGSGSGFTAALELADFDDDGDLDAYVANSGQFPQDIIWLNPGPDVNDDPGLFQAGWIGPVRPSSGLAVADFDGDGDLDIYVTHLNAISGRSNAVWLNDGSGMLSDTGLALGDSQSLAAASADLDEDGDFDVLVVNGGNLAQTDRLWLAEPSVSGPGTADLVFEATPQGAFEVDIDNPARTPPAGMELTVTNLGPDPASNVVIQYREQPSSGSISVDLPVNPRFSCAPGQTEGQQVCTAPLFPVGQAETINIEADSLFGPVVRLRFFQGEQTYEASLSSGSTDPTPGGRSAFVSHTGYDCRRAICPMQRWFCLTGPFWPDPIARAASGESQALSGGFLIDLPVYYLVRQIMNHGSDGQRLVQRYVAHGEEIGDLTVQNLALFDDVIEVLAAWQPLLTALVSGDRDSETVTQARVDLLDDFLAQLETLGSPSLAQAIADERVLIGPFDDLVGLTAGQAADLLIPSDVISERGFERPETLTD